VAVSRKQFDAKLLKKAKKIFDEFITQYKSSEDYYPRKSYPRIILAELQNLSEHEDKNKIIKGFLIQILNKKCIEIMSNAVEPSMQIQIISRNSISPTLFKHGECEELCKR